jgi:hypothetical protein
MAFLGWLAQGVNRDKNQVTLRREFCQKYEKRAALETWSEVLTEIVKAKVR